MMRAETSLRWWAVNRWAHWSPKGEFQQRSSKHCSPRIIQRPTSPTWTHQPARQFQRSTRSLAVSARRFWRSHRPVCSMSQSRLAFPTWRMPEFRESKSCVDLDPRITQRRMTQGLRLIVEHRHQDHWITSCSSIALNRQVSEIGSLFRHKISPTRIKVHQVKEAKMEVQTSASRATSQERRASLGYREEARMRRTMSCSDISLQS